MKEPIVIRNLEVWPLDIGGVTWQDAVQLVAELGSGWRLPTASEFAEILQPEVWEVMSPDLKIGYWSITEIDGHSARNWVFKRGQGHTMYFPKRSLSKVIVVRDFGGEEALEYLLQDF
jgi:hypothetical protein